MNTSSESVAVAHDEGLAEPGPFSHLIRIVLLMMATATFLGWSIRHSEAHLRDGLRSILAAQRIDAGDWRDGVVEGTEHPLHPLAIAAMHRLLGGDGPEWWQRAAVAASFAAMVLLVVPLYLTGRDLFGDRAAWLGCVLFLANPLASSIVVNVLSESTFLLVWTWGLWASVRFLRDGTFGWLCMAVGFGGLAYLARPEGLLLPATLLATLILIPFHRSTRIHWPRWRRATALLVLGAVAFVGPYMAALGTLTPRSGPSRVLGLEPQSPALALERETPTPVGLSTIETYRLATVRMAEVIHANVPLAVLAAALAGLATARATAAPSRTWLFLLILLSVSAMALVRLHATAGYCAARNGLVPGMILTLMAAGGLDQLIRRAGIPGRWFGLPHERLKPGPLVWAVVIALAMLPRFQTPAVATPGPFNVYWDAGRWLSQSAAEGGDVLDLTDWSLYFSRLPGSSFAQIHEAAANADVRWVVALASQVDGPSTYSESLHQLIGDRPPVASLPADPSSGQIQIRIFDRNSPDGEVAGVPPAVHHR